MNKLSKEKKEKLTLVAVGCLGVMVALYLFVISAQKEETADVRLKTEAAMQKLAKAEFWKRNARNITGDLEENRKKLQGLEETMAPADRYKWILDTLNRFAASYPISLVDITRTPEIGEAGVLPDFPYKAATFGVTLSGYFHDFGRFLADFENQHPLIRVENLEMEPQVMVVGSNNEETAAAPSSEKLLIRMRVVALIKPAHPL